MDDRAYRMPLADLPASVLAQILCHVARSDQTGLIEALKARGYATILSVLQSAPQFLAHVDTPTWLRMITDAPDYIPVARDVEEMRYKYRVHDLCDLVRRGGRTAPTARALLQRLRTSAGYADGSPHATLLDDGIAGRARRYPAVPDDTTGDRRLDFMHHVWNATSENHLRVYAREVAALRGQPVLRCNRVPNALQHADRCFCCACVHGPYGPIEVWDTRKVRHMRSAFQNFPEGQLDLAFWDTSRVTCMADMFANMTGKRVVRARRYGTSAEQPNARAVVGVVAGLSDWNTRSATDMSGMFHNCEWTPDVRRWLTSNVTDMSGMFACGSAPERGMCNPDVSRWDTGALENAESMFEGLRRFNCDLGRWDTRRLRVTTRMFRNAGMFDADISRWDMRSVTDADEMFDGCPISDARKPRTTSRARLAAKLALRMS